MDVSRREFLSRSAGAAAALAIMPQSLRAASAAGSKISIGVMGLGGRGTYLAEAFAKRPDAEISYICDVDTRKFARARDAVEQAQGKAPKQVQDFRRILDDKSVDALIIATPDHWHALASILACQAGKDIYVEKPMTHSPWEGRKMIEAAEKYKRVIQVGTQNRSTQYLGDAIDYIRSGKLGEVHLVRVFSMLQHYPWRKTAGGPVPVPAGYDHDMWCGPASLVPYDPARNWLDQWEFSCGGIPLQAVHQLDLARCLIGDLAFPDSVVCSGGIHVLKDGRDTPDTQMVLFDYGKLTMQFEGALWTPYLINTPMRQRDKGIMPNWPFNGMRIEVLGTKGLMYFGRMGGGWQVFNEKGESIVEIAGRQADKEHQDNFVECVRSRKEPISSVAQGHYSTMLCHLANISYRVGNKKLKFDAATETFKDAPEANSFLKRVYRAPWVIPETV